jgi:hypothetical protein
MDELARKVNADPIAFRIGMLDKNPRLKSALRLVAEKSGWGQSLPARTGRGVCVQPSFGSFIATVVEAEVDEHGEVHLRRVTSAVDTGIAVNPDTIIVILIRLQKPAAASRRAEARFPVGSVQRAKADELWPGIARAYQIAKKYKIKTAWGTDVLFLPHAGATTRSD